MLADADKPLDLGTGTVCASFDSTTAAWLSFGATHPDVGFVELSRLRPFDERDRGDPRATRTHRARMVDPEGAFLRLEIDGHAPALEPDPGDPVVPRWSGAGVVVRAEAASAGTIRQRWSFGTAAAATSLAVAVGGRLDRPALAEITETDPPEPTSATTIVREDRDGVTIAAGALGAAVTVRVSGLAVAWRRRGRDVVGSAAIPPTGAELVVECAASAVEGAVVAAPAHPEAPDRAHPLARRALAYVRGCTALATAPDERVILTDHRILPLSWTRDAYWQALLLLATDAPDDRERVADHLRWLWRRCERPDGRWVRSHHANGRRKDRPFQADQQLYPLLELADYRRACAALPGGVDWSELVPDAWAAAVEVIDPRLGLIASMENAADDPALAPYIGASQVLLWYVAARLAEVAAVERIGLTEVTLRSAADAARAAFLAAFANDDRPWPYAVDAAGHRVAYHDANDLPLALAPLWGFCDATNPGWLRTVAVAFSPDNPAWVAGPRAGLGSAHTPGAWTLGDVQAWSIARARDDAGAMASALGRLTGAAFHDGMLPEARERDGRPIRHWFAWPGAAIGALLMLDERGRLEASLGATRG